MSGPVSRRYLRERYGIAREYGDVQGVGEDEEVWASSDGIVAQYLKRKGLDTQLRRYREAGILPCLRMKTGRPVFYYHLPTVVARCFLQKRTKERPGRGGLRREFLRQNTSEPTSTTNAGSGDDTLDPRFARAARILGVSQGAIRAAAAEMAVAFAESFGPLFVGVNQERDQLSAKLYECQQILRSFAGTFEAEEELGPPPSVLPFGGRND